MQNKMEKRYKNLNKRPRIYSDLIDKKGKKVFTFENGVYLWSSNGKPIPKETVYSINVLLIKHLDNYSEKTEEILNSLVLSKFDINQKIEVFKKRNGEVILFKLSKPPQYQEYKISIPEPYGKDYYMNLFETKKSTIKENQNGKQVDIKCVTYKVEIKKRTNNDISKKNYFSLNFFKKEKFVNSNYRHVFKHNVGFINQYGNLLATFTLPFQYENQGNGITSTKLLRKNQLNIKEFLGEEFKITESLSLISNESEYKKPENIKQDAEELFKKLCGAEKMIRIDLKEIKKTSEYHFDLMIEVLWIEFNKRYKESEELRKKVMKLKNSLIFNVL